MKNAHPPLFNFPQGPFRRTKIICTLGPQSVEPQILRQLIQAGMDIARFNFSHGTHDEHRSYVKEVRRQAKHVGKSVALLQDLQGPKIRVGEMRPGVILKEDAPFVITTELLTGTAAIASTTYQRLPLEVKAGDLLLLDDGALKLQVESVLGTRIKTRVLIGGPLGSHKGINVPSPRVSAPILSEKDLADLALGQELGMDLVALSFVRRVEDIQAVRAEIQKYHGWTPFLIAKIEKREAVENLSDIIAAADGIMVARGDLGVELGLPKVPFIQKKAIEAANRQGKWVITATQMLESMIEHSSPTRAEVSDVANAILDGSDAVMLSAETATGKYPILVVKMMAAIVQEIEQTQKFSPSIKMQSSSMTQGSNSALAKAAVAAASAFSSSLILVWDEEGELVRLLSEDRPKALIIGISRSERLCQRWAGFWGVVPVRCLSTVEMPMLWEDIVPMIDRQQWGQENSQTKICLRASSDQGDRAMLEIFTR